MSGTGTPEQPVPSEAEMSAHRERGREDQPRIYVASLSDYNAGRLHGAWIDAAQEPEQIHEDIATILAASREPTAEEWAIHDYDNFGPVHLGEYQDLAAISQIGQGIAEHGPAFAHWAAICGADRDELARFDDVYLGHWDSVAAYAEELLDDLGLEDLIERTIPDHLHAYVTVDVEGFARDLELAGDVTASEGDNGAYLYDQAR